MDNNALTSDTFNFPKIKKRTFFNLTVFAFIYFFFNSFLLPSGLLYTILLTPVMIVWLNSEKVSLVKVFGCFGILFILFYCIHNLSGVDSKAYLVSSTVYLTCVVFSIAFYVYINKYNFTFEPILVKLLKFNFFWVIIALISFPIWKQNNIFWYSNEITESLKFPRLKLFTTESSEYSALLAPIFFFYFAYFYHSNLGKKRFWLSVTIIISLLCSLSFGVIGLIIITITLLLLYDNIGKKRIKNNSKLIVLYFSVVVFILIFILGPGSNTGIAQRVLAIFSGNDSSSNGRAVDSYTLAEIILFKKNVWFGIGPGQLKIVGKDIINDFYQYDNSDDKVVRLPCNMAEVLATFGYLGVSLKLFIEIYLFFRTKVSSSSFRLCIFLFIFFFQFVGSNIVNTLEYVMWVMAFSKVFPDEYFKKIAYNNE